MPANKPYIIGLTGGIGSGKSTAASHLESLGAVQIDADAISRSLTAEGGKALPEIREKFGDGVFNEDGTLNRRALGDITFTDQIARRTLEGIIHPAVQREMMERVDQAAEEGAKVVIFNVPLLFETGMDALCDESWTMYVKPETQLKRVMERDGLTEEQAMARIESQMSADERAERANVVVNAECALEKTLAELTSLFNNVLKRKIAED